RSTASASWTRRNGVAVSSVTAAYGRNDTDHGARNAFFVEGSRHVDMNTIYGRFEALQVETALLQTDLPSEGPAAGDKAPVVAFTVGAGRNNLQRRVLESGVGADVGVDGVREVQQPTYSARAVSFMVL